MRTLIPIAMVVLSAAGCTTPDGGLAMPFSAMVQTRAHHTALSRGYVQADHAPSLYVHPRSISTYQAQGMRVFGDGEVYTATLPELARTLHPTLRMLALGADATLGAAGIVAAAAGISEAVDAMSGSDDDKVSVNVGGDGNVVQVRSSGEPSANSNAGDSNQDREVNEK